jgi:hypothetical protein
MGLFRTLSPAVSSDPYAINVPITLGVDYAGGWMGEARGIDEPFIEPEDLIRESYVSPRPQYHVVRLDQPFYDDEKWPMGIEIFEFPIGAMMPEGTLEPLDDYRLILDGAHA